MTHRIRNHTVHACILGKFINPIEVAQETCGHLAGCSAFRRVRRGIGIDPPKRCRENTGGKSCFAHRQQNHRRLGISAREGQHALVIRGLLRGGDHFICVSRNAKHSAHQTVERRSPTEIVIRQDEKRLDRKPSKRLRQFSALSISTSTALAPPAIADSRTRICSSMLPLKWP